MTSPLRRPSTSLMQDWMKVNGTDEEKPEHPSISEEEDVISLSRDGFGKEGSR